MTELKTLVAKFSSYSPNVDPTALELAWDFASKADRKSVV